MKQLEVRELREGHELAERINELLRLIEEEGETIEITDRGKIIARVVPTSKPKQTVEESDAAAWADLKRIASELDPYWPKNVDAVDIVRDVRREL